MAAKLTRLTHKIAMQLHLVAVSCTICSSRATGGQDGNFWIHHRKPVVSIIQFIKVCCFNVY
jgi:hypothetical protein